MNPRHLLLATVLLAVPGLAHAQGTFPPPSAPNVPIMKSLSQVEPRTPVQSLASAPPYVITQSGSYYLTGNITVATDVGAIAVTSGVSDVTIDLNGFTIESTFASAGTSNAIGFGNSSRIKVCNGNIKSGSTVTSGVITGRGFSNGIYASSKLMDSIISGVNVTGIGDTGIYCDFSSLVENCNVSQSLNGIRNYQRGTTSHCIVTNCGNLGIDSTMVDTCQGSGYVLQGVNGTTVTNSSGTSNSEVGLMATTATNCYGTSSSNTGRNATNASNCNGTSTSAIGLLANCATNCAGYSTSSTGLQAKIANTCTGNSTSSTGLYVSNAMNCYGYSGTGTGLYATNATNCYGLTTANVAGVAGLFATGTANTCQGTAGGSPATGLKAAIAIGCSYSGGILDVPSGKTFNM